MLKYLQQYKLRQGKALKSLYGYSDNKFIRLLCESLFESIYPTGIITNPQSIACFAEDLKQVFINILPQDPDYSVV